MRCFRSCTTGRRGSSGYIRSCLLPGRKCQARCHTSGIHRSHHRSCSSHPSPWEGTGPCSAYHASRPLHVVIRLGQDPASPAAASVSTSFSVKSSGAAAAIYDASGPLPQEIVVQFRRPPYHRWHWTQKPMQGRSAGLYNLERMDTVSAEREYHRITEERLFPLWEDIAAAGIQPGDR